MDAQVGLLVAVRCALAAISRHAGLAQASRRSGERSSQELAFQLTDAQFSVIAVATPGKPGVVIDRIAYSPYGEATRTLRSDVNGDGFVNKDDYAGIIKPRTGAAIGTATYVVEADLDRDGKITQTDYDICIADDGKSSSGGVGEAGLFSKGVRNSVGYCGYVFNEDSGLYTVRFRTYSPTLGRWLERDPAGYVDGMDLYEYVRGGPITAVDPWGLWSLESYSERVDGYFDGHPRFNETERVLWKELWLYDKLCMERAYRQADKINDDEKYRGTTHNGPGDAVRHCTWNCLMTKCLGSKGAQRWGDAHEEGTAPGREDEREMDLHNNQQGRDIYSEHFERNFEAIVRSLPSDDCGFNAVGDVVPDTECKTACEEALAAGRLKVLEKSKWRRE
jgi:RHS repeat-associated protein